MIIVPTQYSRLTEVEKRRSTTRWVVTNSDGPCTCARIVPPMLTCKYETNIPHCCRSNTIFMLLFSGAKVRASWAQMSLFCECDVFAHCVIADHSTGNVFGSREMLTGTFHFYQEVLNSTFVCSAVYNSFAIRKFARHGP